MYKWSNDWVCHAKFSFNKSKKFFRKTGIQAHLWCTKCSFEYQERHSSDTGICRDISQTNLVISMQFLQITNGTQYKPEIWRKYLDRAERR